MLLAVPALSTARARAAGLAFALLLGAAGLWLRPAVLPEPGVRIPATRAARERAIRIWAFRSTDTVRGILDLSHDRDPWVRQQAVQALGVNLVVHDLEHPASGGESRFERAPLREDLRSRLLAVLAGDPVSEVRGEAAHALWVAPRAFGRVEAAAETLAAVLAATGSRTPPTRAVWLALDAAAGPPHPGLKRAAARLALTARDPQLAGAARRAAGAVAGP